jgi:hypothetical protein
MKDSMTAIMRSDRLVFTYKPADKQISARAGKFNVHRIVRSAITGCSAFLTISLLVGCTNAQVRRTPVTDLGEPWFCEMNETRDDWDCVQDETLANNPKPKRLPTDPVEPNPFDEEAPALPETAASTEGLANPSAAINFDAIAQATQRPDTVSAILERSPEHFAVQLSATETQALADGFISGHGLEGNEDLITLELADKEAFYYVVLLGIYDTFAEAQAAVDSRQDTLADVQTWIRPLSSIQTGITEAESLRLGLSN